MKVKEPHKIENNVACMTHYPRKQNLHKDTLLTTLMLVISLQWRVLILEMKIIKMLFRNKIPRISRIRTKNSIKHSIYLLI